MDDWKLQPARDHGLNPHERVVSLRRESGLGETCLHYLWGSFVRTYLRMVHRLRIYHREHLRRKPPFVIVSNHSSHLDAPVLAAAIPWRLTDRVFPIAAGDVFFETAPVAVFSAAMLNALPMWRKNCGRHALQELRQRLVEEPCGYIIFPEGSRSRDGQMVPFRPGLGMLVAGTQAPIVPCHLEGTFQALPPHARWPRPRKIVLRVGEPIDFSSVPDDRSGWEEIAQVTEAAVRGLARRA